MTFKHLTFALENHIARVHINRPPVNALNHELVAELTECAVQIKNDHDIWTIAVTATGKAFCAGADLKERIETPQQEVLIVVKGIQSLVREWCELPQPVIMGLHASALGGGLEFALAGDILVACESAKFGLPETSLGIIPAAGGTQQLAQRTSIGVAKKWILTAQHFSALEAKSDGVVDFVFSSETFEIEFEKIVQMVAANSPVALRQAKRAIETYYQDWLLEGFEHELSLYNVLISTNDRSEALKAYLEKRKPFWNGN